MIALFLGTMHPAAAQAPDSLYVTFTVDPAKDQVRLYWKDDHGAILGSLQQLLALTRARGERLVFGANAGMYRADQSPQGLYIEDGHRHMPADTATTGYGNFYLQPNGVWYITRQRVAGICPTREVANIPDVAYATQSGPLLLIRGQRHPALRAGSSNLNIRNGVGILPDGRLVFAMSRRPVNFYDFASYFLRLGCRDALYLDGFVSRTYCPSQQSYQTDGHFGVMVGVTVRE